MSSYARRALRTVEVDVTTNPQLHAREWTALYEHLVERHHIEGLRSFSAESFEEQLALDGEFRKAGLLAVLGMGSSPGKTNVMAVRAVREFADAWSHYET